MTDGRERKVAEGHDPMELFIGNLLRVGVIVAAVVAAIGGVIFLAARGGSVADYHVFVGQPEHLRSVSGVLTGVAHLDSASIVQLGILLLIATPIARVALSLVAFAREHDRTYVAITALVLALLLFSLAGPGV
jgi:uncharacterized membrane protein